MHGSNTAPLSPGGNYLDKRNSHSGLLVAAVAIHVGVLGVILSYNPEIVGLKPAPPPIELIPIRKPVEPVKPAQRERPKVPPKADPQIEREPVIVERPRGPVIERWPQPPLGPSGPTEIGTGGGGVGGGVTAAEPVLVGAIVDPRFARDQQPPYPPALERQEIEGSVTVRIQIGTDGRVTSVVLIRADDPGFFAATRDWALRKWRFRPATRDGVAIATTLTRTVQFRIVR